MHQNNLNNMRDYLCYRAWKDIIVKKPRARVFGDKGAYLATYPLPSIMVNNEKRGHQFSLFTTSWSRYSLYVKDD